MAQVATLAGVGLKTVSRVINGEPYVSTEVAERVRAAAAQLNYHPNPHAGELRSKGKRHVTIGLLVSSVSNPFAAAVHRAIEDVARVHDAAVFASSLDDEPDRERAGVEAFLRRRLDALILTTVTPSQAYLIPEQNHGTHFVFVDRRPTGVEADAVVSDNAGGAALGVRHLLEHGHRRIAFLGDRHEITTAVQRRHGFFDELGRAGVPSGGVPVIGELHDETDARAAVLQLMRSPDAPTALFTSQNLITIGAIRALRELGLQHEVALVGFDDIPVADLIEPAVTVVAQDPEAIGTLAAERVFARLAGDETPAREYVLPTHLIVRGSGELPPRG